MAWSENARRAALEARRRKRKIPHGASRSEYASELKVARRQSRNWGYGPGKKRNKEVRKQAKFILSPRMQYGD